MRTSSEHSSELSVEYGSLGWEKDPSNLFVFDSDRSTPERNLWIEVINQALIDIGIPFRYQQRETLPSDWKAAVDWVMEESETYIETDFEYVCHTVQIDAEDIRSKVAKFVCRCCNNRLIEKQCPRRILK